MYYLDKIDRLKRIFGSQRIGVTATHVIVGDRSYPVVDDVIICLPPEKWPASLRDTTSSVDADPRPGEFAEDIQHTFGEEWKSFPQILPDHEQEFADYFDIVDLPALAGQQVCDLGCGIGRWSHFLAPYTSHLVLVDFSDAIFVARKNLEFNGDAIFVMADILDLPFAADAFDFLACLGVLHHLPANALAQVGKLRSLSPRLLIYLYYALDNRPPFFRGIIRGVTVVRERLARVRGQRAREALTTVIAVTVYTPLIVLGHAVAPFGLGKYVPLFEGYRGKSLGRVRQDVYDRFFTRIEQRFSRAKIGELKGSFREVIVSDNLPYWHFLCIR